MHLLEQWLQNSTVSAIGWTLLHSLWQGAIAAAAAGIIILCTRRSPALLRYNLISGVAVLFLLGSIVTLFTRFAATRPVATTAVTADPAACLPEPGIGGTISTFFNQYAGWIVMAWGAIFLFRICRMAGSLAYIGRLRTKEASLPSNEWRNRFYDLKHDMGIKKVVRLMESRLVKVPLTIGVLKPIVLMPLGLLGNLPAAELETILVHELAHIRRNDYLVNLLHQITITIFFFNPALLWISALLKEEREACCDEIVIHHTQRKETYMQALVSFQEFTLTQNRYAMTLKDQQGALFSRMKRMLTSENEQLGSTGKLMLLAGAVTITSLCFLSATPVAVAGKCAATVQDTTPVEKTIKIEEVSAPARAAKKSAKAQKAAAAHPIQVHHVKKVSTDSVWMTKDTTWKTGKMYHSDSSRHFKSQQTAHVSIQHQLNVSPKLHINQHKIKNVNVDVKTNVNTNIVISRKEQLLLKQEVISAVKFKHEERQLKLKEHQLKLTKKLAMHNTRLMEKHLKEKKLILEKAGKILESREAARPKKADRPIPASDPQPEIEIMP